VPLQQQKEKQERQLSRCDEWTPACHSHQTSWVALANLFSSKEIVTITVCTLVV